MNPHPKLPAALSCVDEIQQKARHLYQFVAPRAAIDALEVALRRLPDAGLLWQLRADFLARQQRFDEALEDITKAQLIVPLDGDGRLILARSLWFTGKQELSREVLLELFEDDRLTTEQRHELLAALESAQLWHEAAAVARDLLTHTPDDDRIHFALAKSLMHLKRPVELIVSLLEQAIQLAPEVTLYRVTLAVLHCTRRDTHQSHACILRLSSKELSTLTCKCCLSKLLLVCCNAGDAERASCLATRLANLNAASPTHDAGHNAG